MVELTQQLFMKGAYKIATVLDNLIDHVNNFRKLTNSSAKVQQYEAKSWTHDDLVACLLMLSVYIVEALWLVDKKDIIDYGDEKGIDYLEMVAYNNQDTTQWEFYNWMF